MKYSFIILFIMSSLGSFGQHIYQQEWKDVDSLSGLGQPKSALELVERIYQSAKAKKDAP